MATNDAAAAGRAPVNYKIFVPSARNAHLSNWLTAVEETARRRQGFSDAAAPADGVHPMVAAAAAHVQRVENGETIPDHTEDENDPNHPGLLATLSNLFFRHAEAARTGDDKLQQELEMAHLKYSKFDLLGWTSSVTTYLANYMIWGKPVYRDWNDCGGINASVIEYKLPNDALVGIIADWGTGTESARDMLYYIIKNHDLDAIIHLGDIYYSGTKEQCAENFYDIFNEVFETTGKRVPVLMVPGNHDYYAYGHGFYWLIDNQNPASQPTWQQPASFFCLRTEDNMWQLLAMDSGLGDYNPDDQISKTYAGPGLTASEIEWHIDKLKNFQGRTVLLSHHQLFSTNTRITPDTPNVNQRLHNIFSPYFDKIAVWLWGHEHSMAFYQDGYQGLAKGRLIGCGSYNAADEEQPYEVKYPEVPFMKDMPELGIIDNYYNHGFALLDLERKHPGDKVRLTYHQLPVWNGGEKKVLPPDQPYQLFEEEVA